MNLTAVIATLLYTQTISHVFLRLNPPEKEKERRGKKKEKKKQSHRVSIVIAFHHVLLKPDHSWQEAWPLSHIHGALKNESL